MWPAVRDLLFPVSCLGCGCERVALCAACAPLRGDAVPFAVDGVPGIAVGAYDGLFRRAIVAMKGGERAYLDAFAPLLARTLPINLPLVPLPTTRRRRAARGFDQAVELARRTAALRGVATCEALSKGGAAQRGRGRGERLAAAGRFRIRPGAVLPPAAIVLDDVCTTGGTLRDGIATLRAAGVTVAGAFVLAWTAPGRNHRGARAV